MRRGPSSLLHTQPSRHPDPPPDTAHDAPLAGLAGRARAGGGRGRAGVGRRRGRSRSRPRFGRHPGVERKMIFVGSWRAGAASARGPRARARRDARRQVARMRPPRAAHCPAGDTTAPHTNGGRRSGPARSRGRAASAFARATAHGHRPPRSPSPSSLPPSSSGVGCHERRRRARVSLELPRPGLHSGVVAAHAATLPGRAPAHRGLHRCVECVCVDHCTRGGGRRGRRF